VVTSSVFDVAVLVDAFGSSVPAGATISATLKLVVVPVVTFSSLDVVALLTRLFTLYHDVNNLYQVLVPPVVLV
jgi:hypothetical protein